VDQRPDGTLVLRDYKTGRAPRDDGQVFRPGVQLQIPIYLLALRRLFPERTVSEAFLDYVDGGRLVSVDPTSAAGERLERLLAGLVDAITSGLFVQEPAACATCDFCAVCGPQPLLARRRVYKLEDPIVRRYLRLKERT
jgi:RecB family exonuclease